MSGPPVVAGVHETAYRRGPGRFETPALLAQAARGALNDAGLRGQEVDGLAVSSFTLRPDRAVDLAWKLGLRLRWLMDDGNGGASALTMLQHARRALEAGDAEVVLLLAGDRFRRADFSELVDGFNRATRNHLAPLPYGGPNALFALLTQRHMIAHGLDRSDYGQVAVSQRAWAALNPGAVYRGPLSIEDYLAAPIVAEPLGRYDCAPVVAGADAIVLTTRERAHRRRTVKVEALECSFNWDGQQGAGIETGLRPLAPRLWATAGLGPGEVDLACVYDDYPVMVLVQLADLGFVPDGDLGRFIYERLATRALPVNTSGGQLSAGQAGAAGGMHLLVEAFRQLAGRAGRRQLRGAKHALVTGYGMVLYRHGACACAAVLGRDP